MKQIILVCGLISGIIMAIFMITVTARYSSDQHFENGMIYGYAVMVLAFSLIFVGVKNFRDKYHDGTITFGKAFRIGLYIALIGSTIYVIVWLIEFYFFIPDFMDKYAAHIVRNMQAKGLSQIQINKQITEVNAMKEMYKNPIFVVLITYSEVLPVGLAISLISAFILRRKSGNKELAATGNRYEV